MKNENVIMKKERKTNGEMKINGEAKKKAVMTMTIR